MVCVLATTSLMAQPTLTGANSNPVAGDQFINVSSNYVSPGSAGASQTWNLSSLTVNSTSTVTVSSAASTTYGASFPASNLATTSNGTSFEYFNGNSSVYQSYGSASSASVDSYTDPEDRFQYPFTYLSSFTDAFSSVYTSGSTTYYRTGTTNVTADGYGTLTTPSGTYTNVLRVNTVFSYQDSATGGTNKYQRNTFAWYIPNNHTSIATVSSFTFTPSSGSPISNQVASYQTNVITAIEPLVKTQAACAITPNPASSNINCSVTLAEGKTIDIKLYNSLGMMVAEKNNLQSTAGVNTYSLDVSSLPAGIYFAEISLDKTPSMTKKCVITR